MLHRLLSPRSGGSAIRITTGIRPGHALVACLGLAIGTPCASASQPAGHGGAGATPTITDADKYRQHDMTLSNPFFEGRAPGTRGNQLAADYLEFQFRRLNLVPAFPKDENAPAGSTRESFRQPFALGEQLKVTQEQVSFGGVDLKPGADFNVLGFSGTAEATGPIAFVGYGIPAGQDGYASYEPATDLKGKIALILRFEPMTADGKSKWTGGESWSFAAALEPKITAAVKRGAAGVILVNPPGAQDDRVGKLEDVSSSKPRGEAASIPVVMMSTERADELVRKADTQGRSLLDLRKLADDKGEVIDLPKTPVTLRTGVTRDPIMTSNVAAILPGVGELADEFVVIGAHYDHVGYGYFGSMDNSVGKIHPGADDNASGTSGMLLLAERFSTAFAAEAAPQPRRSILFMGFTGEESGLNGSRHYTRHMIADKSKHYLMINLDMIGRLREAPPLEVSGVGTADGLEAMVKPILENSGIKTMSQPGGLGPSDHASFYRAGIPVLFLFTGLHDQYHRPTDTANLINVDGAVKVVDLAEAITRAAIVRREPLPYRGEEKTAQSDQAVPQTSTRVRFGIAPGDYSGNDGILVGEVYPNTSAADAGLKEGDRMIKWNGEKLTSVESWMPILGNHKPGDKVEIVYVRDGKELTTTATLKARSNRSQ